MAPNDSPITVADSADLLVTAAAIRATNPSLADLLEAVHEMAEDGMHTMTQYTDSEPECVDDCPPCVAENAARLVATEYLAGVA